MMWFMVAPACQPGFFLNRARKTVGAEPRLSSISSCTVPRNTSLSFSGSLSPSASRLREPPLPGPACALAALPPEVLEVRLMHVGRADNTAKRGPLSRSIRKGCAPLLGFIISTGISATTQAPFNASTAFALESEITTRTGSNEEGYMAGDSLAQTISKLVEIHPTLYYPIKLNDSHIPRHAVKRVFSTMYSAVPSPRTTMRYLIPSG